MGHNYIGLDSYTVMAYMIMAYMLTDYIEDSSAPSTFSACVV